MRSQFCPAFVYSLDLVDVTFSLPTGQIENFSLGGLATYAVAGTAAGAVAGLTFNYAAAAGTWVAATAGLAASGTASAMASGAVTLGLTLGAAGTTAGLVGGAGMAAAEGKSAGQIVTAGLTGAGKGLFNGAITGLVAGAALPIAAVGGSGWLGGAMAMGGSMALGDWVAQHLAVAARLQAEYNPLQTLFVGLTSFAGGAYAGYKDPSLGAFTSGFRSPAPEAEAVPRPQPMVGRRRNLVSAKTVPSGTGTK